jgi:hypothetical protein
LGGRGVVVETPAVRIPDRRQVCWRVRVGATPGSVLLRARGVVITKAVRCGHGLRYLSATPWDGSPSIDVSCPAATLDVAGFGIDWPVWFGIVSLITMLALKQAR